MVSIPNWYQGTFLAVRWRSARAIFHGSLALTSNIILLFDYTRSVPAQGLVSHEAERKLIPARILFEGPLDRTRSLTLLASIKPRSYALPDALSELRIRHAARRREAALHPHACG
jgi:hypothetical protein